MAACLGAGLSIRLAVVLDGSKVRQQGVMSVGSGSSTAGLPFGGWESEYTRREGRPGTAAGRGGSRDSRTAAAGPAATCLAGFWLGTCWACRGRGFS